MAENDHRYDRTFLVDVSSSLVQRWFGPFLVALDDSRGISRAF